MCFNFGTFFNTVPGSLYITSRLPHAFIDQLHPGLEVVVICIELRISPILSPHSTYPILSISMYLCARACETKGKNGRASGQGTRIKTVTNRTCNRRLMRNYDNETMDYKG